MRTWSKPAVVVTLAAAAILMVTMGARQSLGLFVSPLNTSTGETKDRKSTRLNSSHHFISYAVFCLR